uniref:Uncharacterized protein n=1 Tax=Arundo donax TaxID=35708 RepID=A0A0A9DPA7_ARUDO
MSRIPRLEMIIEVHFRRFRVIKIFPR